MKTHLFKLVSQFVIPTLVMSTTLLFLISSTGCGNLTEPFHAHPSFSPPAADPSQPAPGSDRDEDTESQVFELIKVDLAVALTEKVPLLPHAKGLPPFQFVLISGKGEIIDETLSAAEAGLNAVMVRDSEANIHFINVHFHEPLTLTLMPATATLGFSQSAQVIVHGGLPPCKFSLMKSPRPLGARSEMPAGLTLDRKTGVLTSGTTEGSALVEVEDSMGTKAQLDLVILSREPGSALPTPPPTSTPPPAPPPTEVSSGASSGASSGVGSEATLL